MPTALSPPPPTSQSHPFHPFKSNNTHHSDFNDVHHSYLTTYTPFRFQRRTHSNSTMHLFQFQRHTHLYFKDTHILVMSPERAILIHSPGRKPWVNNQSTYLEPQRGGTHPKSKCPDTRAVSAAPTELNPLLSVFTQGSISGFALIPPWAMQEYRA